MRIRTLFAGVDAALSPHAAHPFLRNAAANLPLPHGRTTLSAPTERCAFSPMACTIFRLRVAGSMRRPQASFEAQPRAARLLAPKMGIDPYGDFAWSPFIVRFCDCILHGRGRTPPLRQIITSSLFTITSYLSCPAPTLRLKPSPEEIPPGASFNAAQYVFVSVPRSFPARSGFCRPRGR